MRLIFKSIEELNEVLPIPVSMNFKALEGSIDQLQTKWLVPMISKAQFDHFLDMIEGSDSIPVLKQNAIRLCRMALAPIIVRESADILNINMVQGGFTVNKSEKTDVASANRVLLLKEQLTVNAQEGINQLIDFIEANENTFNLYRDSIERRERKKLFVSSVEKFNSGLPGLTINHFVYQKLRQVIEVTESRYLVKILGADLFSHLKTLISTSASLGVYAPIVPFIERAIPSIVLAECIDPLNIKIDERGVYVSIIRNANEPQQTEKGEMPVIEKRLRKYAEERMEDLASHLTENATTYPLFQNSSAFIDRSVERISAEKKGAYYGTN